MRPARTEFRWLTAILAPLCLLAQSTPLFDENAANSIINNNNNNNINSVNQQNEIAANSNINSNFNQQQHHLQQRASKTCGSSEACEGGRSEHLLLQRTGLAITSSEALEEEMGEGLRLDALATQHLQATFRSPRGVGMVISNGLSAIRSCLTSLTKDNPDIQSGFTTMGSQLITVISDMLPTEYLNGVNFGKFAASVQAQLRSLSQENDILDGIRNYTSLGNTDNLMQVLSTSLERMMAIATEEFGQNTGFNVAKYISSLNDMLEGTSDSLAFVKDGDQKGGLGSVWKGVKAAIEGLMPSDQLSNETYTEVVAGTQDVLGTFMDDVLTFVRAFMDSEVCWKRSEARPKVRPTVCPSGYTFVSEQWCMPTSGTSKAIRASCPEGLKAQGSWCLQSCTAEYKTFLRICKQRCAGAYSIESPLMCGSAQGAIAVAIVEILAKTAIAAVTQVGLVNIALSAGYVFVSSMTTVLNAFVNFAKPFGFPHCPADLANTEAMSLEDALARVRERASATTTTPALPGLGPSPSPELENSEPEIGTPAVGPARSSSSSTSASASSSPTAVAEASGPATVEAMRQPLAELVPPAIATTGAPEADDGGEEKIARESLRREKRG